MACTPATASPVAAYAASSMCNASGKDDGLSMPAIGSTLTIVPLEISKPVGVFIQPFTITTKTADAAPLAATMAPAARCARAEMRVQP